MTLPDSMRREFTLMEMIAVLAIIGLALALVLPRIGRVPARVAVAGAVSQLRTAARDAGMRARATGRPCQLVLMPDENTWRIRGGASGAASPDSAESALPTTYDMGSEVAWHLDGLEDSANGVTIEFHPDGGAASMFRLSRLLLLSLAALVLGLSAGGPGAAAPLTECGFSTHANDEAVGCVSYPPCE